MNRTYNFQVDNGLFVAAYYLKKDYKDITLQDLKDNIKNLAEKIYEVNEVTVLNSQKKPTRLSSTTHLNSVLTQSAFKTNRKEKIEQHLELLLNNIGNDRHCSICGEKRVNLGKIERTDKKNEKEYLPYSSLMYGVASLNNFVNSGNNLMTVDVCPVCLFYSLVSILNTQKISYPFLYLSDSDAFMRDITERVQGDVAAKTLLNIKEDSIGENFMDVMSEFVDIRDNSIYEDMTYINLIQYTNGQTNFYRNTEITKEQIYFLLKVKYAGMITEFFSLNLFYRLMRGSNLVRSLIGHTQKVSKGLYKIIKEETMTTKELNQVNMLVDKLTEEYGSVSVIKELNLVKDVGYFRALLKKYTKDIDFGLTLVELDYLVKNYKTYVDYLVIETQMRLNQQETDEKNKEVGGEENGK